MGGRRLRQAIVCASAVGLAVALSAAARPTSAAGAPLPDGFDNPRIPVRVASELAEVTAGLEVREERFAPDADPPVVLRFFLKPDREPQSDRLVAATVAALGRFNEWYGPYPLDRLTVIDVPWQSPLADAVYPGVVMVSSRWLAPARDVSLERAVIAALARQYWQVSDGGAGADRWLEEGLALYSATRAIHAELEGRHFATLRYFGGFLPFTIRTLLLSPTPTDPRPRVRSFAELESRTRSAPPASGHAVGVEAHRTALALDTLERYIGWPALQQTLFTFRARVGPRAATVGDLVAVASELRGRDLSWFFDEAFRFSADFDYGVAAFDSTSEAGTADTYRTVVRLRRYGDAVFAGTAERESAASSGSRAIPVRVAFEDGTTVRDWWDGRDRDLELQYVSRAPAVSVSVDPDVMLLLDRDRTNNSVARPPVLHGTGVRLVLHWLVWLQDLVLTRTALV